MRCLFRGLLIIIGTLGLLFVVIRYWSSIEHYRIKRLPARLEQLTQSAYQIESANLLETLSNDSQSNQLLINEMVEKHELCSIKSYPGRGVAYYFKCKNDSYDNFVDTDDEYYLVKVYDHSQANDFLSYEHFIDYGGPPDKLANDWYFFAKQIYFD